MRVLPKIAHELRCPVHGFVQINNLERRILDTPPVQRLKHIHQLAMTYQVYPGATHRRFEHSLGVMDLAGRAFDSLLSTEKLQFGAEVLGEAADRRERDYWRQVLRIAALIHDIGHLPFSHAAEKQLLPAGWTHEHLTRDLILNSEITEVLARERPAYHPEDVVRLALEPDEQPETALTPWQAILNQILTGSTFGVDRMDYLLRDSYHAGVGYGRFDPLRLLDSLTIVAPANPEETHSDVIPSLTRSGSSALTQDPESLVLGVMEGGVQGAEALLLARYFMWSQVYLHHVRRGYDLHLKDFMMGWLPEGKYPITLAKHLRLNDNIVLAAIDEAAATPGSPGHEAARRIVQRNHFRRAYSLNYMDFAPTTGHPNAARLLEAALHAEFGQTSVSVDYVEPKGGKKEVPVLTGNGEVVSGLAVSDVLNTIPPAWCAYVLCSKELVEPVRRFIERRKSEILLGKEESVKGYDG
ncbi:MAG: HD domain-containing protein [Actinomycetota bacterium]